MNKSVRYLFGIRAYAGHQVASATAVDYFKRHTVEFVECVAADIAYSAVGYFVCAQRNQPLEKGCCGYESAEYEKTLEHGVEIHIVFADYIVYCIAYHNWSEQSGGYLQKCKKQRKYEPKHIRFYVGEQSPYRTGAGGRQLFFHFPPPLPTPCDWQISRYTSQLPYSVSCVP